MKLPDNLPTNGISKDSLGALRAGSIMPHVNGCRPSVLVILALYVRLSYQPAKKAVLGGKLSS